MSEFTGGNVSAKLNTATYALGAHTLCRRRSDCSQLFMLYQARGFPTVLRPFEFMRVTQLHQRNVMVFQEPKAMCYIRGISGEISNMSKFLTWQTTQRGLNFPHVRTTYCFGISSGAYGAITSGYFLKVPIVWAFGPPVSQIGSAIDVEDSTSRRCMDLAELLREGNGCTEYRIYYNDAYAPDREAASRLAGCAGVRLFPQAGEGHGVITALFESGQLAEVFPPFESVSAGS